MAESDEQPLLRKTYQTPEVRVFGSLKDMTGQLNKVGTQADIFTVINDAIVGSIISA